MFKRGCGCMVRELTTGIVLHPAMEPDCLPQDSRRLCTTGPHLLEGMLARFAPGYELSHEIDNKWQRMLVPLASEQVTSTEQRIRELL